MAHSFPWHLIERIGVYSQDIYQQVYQQVTHAVSAGRNIPRVEIKSEWYY